MARLTLLEMVTDILSDMDSDPVTSYLDTTESQQVAQILQTTYYNIIDGRDWPHLYNLLQLTETSSTTPTRLTIPNTIVEVLWVKYDKRRSGDTRNKFTEIVYKTPHEFMNILNARKSDNSNIDIITDTSGLVMNIYNDKPPQWYTTFDDDSVVMDAYDSAVESFLRTSKTQCYGKIYPTPVCLSDGLYFDLPTEGYSYLLNEAKSTAFMVLKQMPNGKAEEYAKSQKRRMSWEAHNIDKNNRYPDFGRKRFIK